MLMSPHASKLAWMAQVINTLLIFIPFKTAGENEKPHVTCDYGSTYGCTKKCTAAHFLVITKLSCGVTSIVQTFDIAVLFDIVATSQQFYEDSIGT